MRRTICTAITAGLLMLGTVPVAAADGTPSEPVSVKTKNVCQGYADDLVTAQAENQNLRAHAAVLNETIRDLEHWYGAVLESRDRQVRLVTKQQTELDRLHAQVKRQHAYIERLRAALARAH